MSEHSGLPWEVAHYEDGILEGVNFIRSVDEPSCSICSLVGGGKSPGVILANASIIVTACNSHAALVETVKDFLSPEYRVGVFCQRGRVPKCMCRECVDKRGDAALKLARVQS